jgi:hypothetical protein
VAPQARKRGVDAVARATTRRLLVVKSVRRHAGAVKID